MSRRPERRSAAEQDAERRRILRQVTLWMWIYGGLAVILAVGSGALAAWLLGRVGLPFVPTWVVVTAITAGVPVAIHLVQAFRNRRAGPEPGGDGR